MLRYTATDIIKRAEQLADLENSDFISDEEKLTLLNESFTALYQKVINAGGKEWVKTVTVHNGDELPEDFYQMTALYVKASHEQINRRNAAQTEGYELRNNRIVLSAPLDQVEVEMEYAPVPPTVSLKAKSIVSPYATGDANGNLYASSDGLRSLKSANMVEWPSGLDTVLGVFGNGVLYEDEEGDKHIMKLNGTVVESVELPIVNEGNVYSLNAETGRYYDGEVFMGAIDASLIVEDAEIIYCDGPDVWQMTEGYICINDGDAILIPECGVKMKGIMGKAELYVTGLDGKLYRVTAEGAEEMKTKFPCAGVTSRKYAVTVDEFSSQYWLEGMQEDTLLEYPNQLFWTLLAYMLAVHFRAKQGSDTSAVGSLMADAEKQFFDSISQDTNASYQMKNVYAARARIYR